MANTIRPPTEGELHESLDRLRSEREKFRAIFYDALHLCAMAGTPKKNGYSEVSVSDLDRLSESINAAEYLFLKDAWGSKGSSGERRKAQTPTQPHVTTDEGWGSYGGSTSESENTTGWQR